MKNIDINLLESRITAIKAAQIAEYNNEWQLAKEYWEKAPKYSNIDKEFDNSQINAINMIINASIKGNEYRSRIKEYTEQWEKRNLTNKKYFRICTEIYNEIYK